jgi:hypothetical protein
MLDAGTQNGLPDVRCQVFVRKFSRVNADDNQLIGKLLSKSTQLRNVVVAVYSGISPELKQNDFAAQRPQ